MTTAVPVHRAQSATVEYGYPQGHLGHLSVDEETAFQNFKLLCEEKGLYKPANGDEPGTHEDATLLRFLRARRFNIQDALKQFQDTEQWRNANQLDELYNTIDLEHYEETRRLYPQWTGRRDRRGIPVYVYEVKHLNSKTMAAYEKSAKETLTKATSSQDTPPKLLRLFALYENLVRFVMPLCTAMTDRDNPRTPITQSNNIVDISGVGLKQFWNLRGHMQDASTLATAHYPETLDRIFIIGAPAFFPTVWGWIKKWFDPITTSKIFILSHSEVKKTLEFFIDPVNIPKQYGGELEFQFGDTPVLDPALEKVMQWEGKQTNFPAGPLFWTMKSKIGEAKGVDGTEEGEMSVIAVGTKEGAERREIVGTITKTLPKLTTEEISASLANGHAVEPAPEVAPAAAVAVAAATILPHPEANTEKATGQEPQIESGSLVPPSRPEPTTFHTAKEELATLSISEKSPDLPNGTATAGTALAGDAEVPSTTGTKTAEPAAPTDGEVVNEKSTANGNGVPLVEKIKGAVGV